MAILYMGMEYSLTETTRVAIQCFKEAEVLSKTKNPFVFGEIGVCFYKSGNYEYSCLYIKDAIKILESDFIVDSSGLPAKFWEPFYNNLGHALRRSKMYQDALKCHRKALKMVGDSVIALEGLAITLMMMNRLPEALACFSRAVDLRKPISMSSPTSLGIMLIVRIMNKLETIEKGITTQITSDADSKKTELCQKFLEEIEYLEC